MNAPKFSIVSPVYRAEQIVPHLVERIVQNIEPLSEDYEIVLVEDGSPDRSWEAIELECEKSHKVKGLRLSRNFGQHYAITAGLDHAKGEWIFVMDCDLQDRPEEFAPLYQKAQEGYDYVLASRHSRTDGFFKKLFSKLFYRSLSYLSGSIQDHTVANFGIYKRNVIDAVVSMRESIRYFPTMVKWVGFNGTKINVEHGSRHEGESTYNLKRLFRLALDIILAYSDKPLSIMIRVGFWIALISSFVSIYYLLRWLAGGIVVQGYTSLIMSIWFLSGVIIITIGIVGRYIGKIFEGVRERPIYIVKTKLND